MEYDKKLSLYNFCLNIWLKYYNNFHIESKKAIEIKISSLWDTEKINKTDQNWKIFKDCTICKKNNYFAEDFAIKIKE